MRLVLIVLGFAFIFQCQAIGNLNASAVEAYQAKVQASATCRSDFAYFQGWCVWTTGLKELSYDDAVDQCTKMDAFGPSIHSKREIDFWIDALAPLGIANGHFWLNAYCLKQGEQYKWMDGTPTDYNGTWGELENCQMEFEYTISPEYGLTSENLGANPVAPALCAYAVDPAPLPKPPAQGDCRDEFEYHEGLCVWSTGDVYWLNLFNAEEQCKRMGAFPPSIHSEKDLERWTSVALNTANQAMWVDAHCLTNGEPYKWADRTPTDYYGPNNELKSCETGTGVHIVAHRGLAIVPLRYGAATYCVYDPHATPSTPKPRNSCGEAIVKPDISNANPATVVPYSWPWHVIWCSKNWFSDKICDFECGASIVAPGWVLTAAHCAYDDLNPKNYKVKAGVFDETTSDQDAEQTVAVKAIHIHPQYDSRKMINDIALIELATNLTFGDHVQPVCLPTTDDGALKYPGDIWVTGFGTADIATKSRKLHQADVPIVDYPTCKNQYPGNVNDEVEFCAGKLGVDTCQGDMGGPMVSEGSSGSWYQYGLVSWGCAEKGPTGVYARVSAYCKWIEETTNMAVECQDVL